MTNAEGRVVRFRGHQSSTFGVPAATVQQNAPAVADAL
jgi:hypothetical protein